MQYIHIHNMHHGSSEPESHPEAPDMPGTRIEYLGGEGRNYRQYVKPVNVLET